MMSLMSCDLINRSLFIFKEKNWSQFFRVVTRVIVCNFVEESHKDMLFQSVILLICQLSCCSLLGCGAEIPIAVEICEACFVLCEKLDSEF